MRLNRFRIGVAVGAACVIAVVALVLTGMGGDANVVSGSAIADAASATERLPGANVSMLMTFDIGGLPKPVLMGLHGVQDFRGQSGHFAGEFRNVPKGLGAKPDGTSPVAAIVRGSVIYMKGALVADGLPDGKEWIKEDSADDQNELGFDPNAVGQDPRKLLAFLRATSDHVEPVGREDVRGVSTTHYRAKVEFSKYLDAVPVTDREKAQKSIDSLTRASGTNSFPVEVWVDGHHLVRRIALSIKTITDAATQTPFKLSVRMELFGFGPKRVPDPPPAELTVDASKVPGP